MNSLSRKVILVLLVLAMAASFVFVGCGGGKEAAGQTLVIGCIVDVSGVASNSIKPVVDSILDTARWYNDHNLAPGVTMNVLIADNPYTARKTIQDYNWLRSQGANVIVCVFADEAKELMASTTADQVPVYCLQYTADMLHNPGWVFGLSTLSRWQTWGMLDWVWTNDWSPTHSGPAKIGQACHYGASNVETGQAMQDYATAYPDRFTFVADVELAYGLGFESAVQTLKDCNYISSFATDYALLFKAYNTAFGWPASHPEIFGFGGSIIGNLAFMADMNGWAMYDAAIDRANCPCWDQLDTVPMVALCNEIIQAYRSADYISTYGLGGTNPTYQGSMAINDFVIFDSLAFAVKESGGDISGQSLYNGITNWKMDTKGPLWKTYQEEGFALSSNGHIAIQWMEPYRVTAAKQGLEWTGDWCAVITSIPGFAE